MIHSKKYILAVFLLVFPWTLWSQAPVVDESDNFAMTEEQEWGPPEGSSRFQSQEYKAQEYSADHKYSAGFEDETPLVKDDRNPEVHSSRTPVNASANLIDKIQSLRQEIQELRGQLEIQAHDLKLLQEQQIAFYKDLDSRLGTGSNKLAESKPHAIAPRVSQPSTAPSIEPKPQTKLVQPDFPSVRSGTAGSRINPADEQISYLAAYELIKNKQYDEALRAMDHFVKKYPQGGYTANAQYWLGELYLLKKDYPQSISHFETVLRHYPSSSKAAACMLKVGYAYAASGNVISAKKRLQTVLKVYPNTATAQLATTKLASLNAL
jgi:tol-pal system protein YbgF